MTRQSSNHRKTTFGVIIGNRSFFPDGLCVDGRKEILDVLKAEGFGAIILDPKETKFGSVETLQDARKCADLFAKHKDEIIGIVVSLPNFGDERSVADAIRRSELNVPVLVQASPDEPDRMQMGGRRDAFCGKISVCNNLWQYGVRFSLTAQHTVAPTSEAFRADLRSFAATCRVVRGLKNIRVGVIGARPAPFATVRFSEKLMEHSGISVETLDLSEALGRVEQLKDGDARVKNKVAVVKEYVSTKGIPEGALLKMAKFGVVTDEWVDANGLAGTSLQCWTALQEYFGVMPCTLMSMMSNNLLPSACETDMIGMVGMYVLQLASETPSAIVDWNNNFGTDPDKALIFHCSNLPKHFFADFRMDFNEIIAIGVGKEQSFGTVVGPLRNGPITYCRVSTDDLNGRIRSYVGEGELTQDKVQSFGGYGVVRVPGLQRLMQYVCRNGYEHHVSVNLSQCGPAVADALKTYKGWDVHYHEAAGC